MFSKSCEYAIKALIYIHSRSSIEGMVKVNDISGAIDAPVFYVSKILQKLVKQDIVASMKGPQGGFYIDKKHKAKRLIDIVGAIDGDKIFNGCGLGISMCSESHPCPLHNQFKGIRLKIKKMLLETTIEQLSISVVDNSLKILGLKKILEQDQQKT